MKTVHADEIAIAKYLSSEASSEDPRNHCVPVLDFFPDPLDHEIYLMVMPYLRPFDDPPFGAIGEVIDCVQQTLEVRPCPNSLDALRPLQRGCRVYVLFIVKVLPIGA